MMYIDYKFKLRVSPKSMKIVDCDEARLSKTTTKDGISI
jgi:hypothetical protein